MQQFSVEGVGGYGKQAALAQRKGAFCKQRRYKPITICAPGAIFTQK